MTYGAEMMTGLFLSHGVRAELTELRMNSFMEEAIYTVRNPKAVTRDVLAALSAIHGGNSTLSFKDRKLSIETDYDTEPRAFSTYSMAIKQSKASLPVFLGESMNGWEIVVLKKEGNILICGRKAKARNIILKTALASLSLSPRHPEIAEVDSADDFIKCIKAAKERQTDSIVVIRDLPKLLSSDKGARAMKLLQSTGKGKKLHCIALTGSASGEVLNDEVKKLFPVRITAQTASALNSKLILGTSGAELLRGDYDYLLLRNGKVTRVRGAKV